MFLSNQKRPSSYEPLVYVRDKEEEEQQQCVVYMIDVLSLTANIKNKRQHRVGMIHQFYENIISL